MKKCCKKIVIIMSLIILTIPILIPASNTGKCNPLTIDDSEVITNLY